MRLSLQDKPKKSDNIFKILTNNGYLLNKILTNDHC